jgi:16S rRNA (guanine527-N7)-methyltransferase
MPKKLPAPGSVSKKNSSTAAATAGQEMDATDTGKSGIPRDQIELLTARLGPLVPAAQIPLVRDRLVQYVRLLLEWNRRSNLISKGDESRLVERHLLDSFLVVPVIDRLGIRSALDLGSGGGLPGIPAKILRPEIQLTLLDSRRSKALFLLRAITVLGLRGARAWQERVEELGGLPSLDEEAVGSWADLEPGTGGLEGPRSRPAFDLILARAVSSLARLAAWTEPLVPPGGHLLALKGSRIDDEIAEWESDPGGWILAELTREVRPRTHLVLLRRT